MTKNALLITEDDLFLERFGSSSSALTITPHKVTSFESAIIQCATSSFDMALVDNDLYDNKMIVMFFKDIKMLWPHISRILLLGRKKSIDVVDAVNNADIERVLCKSWNASKIAHQIKDATATVDVWHELKHMKKLVATNNKELHVLYQLIDDQVFSRSCETIKRNERISTALLATMKAFSKILETKDLLKDGHSERVAHICVEIGKELGLANNELDGLYIAGFVRDLGKIAVSEFILQKEGLLTNEEFDLVREHPIIGYNILKPIPFEWDVAGTVLEHHEFFNGKGYPYQLSGKNICLGARIVHIADAFEAMISDRPYRPALEPKEALSEIEKNAGTQFDPEIVAAFLNISLNKIVKKN